MTSHYISYNMFQVFATPEERDIRLNGFDFVSPNTAIVGLNGGKMAVVDFRSKG